MEMCPDGFHGGQSILYCRRPSYKARSTSESQLRRTWNATTESLTPRNPHANPMTNPANPYKYNPFHLSCYEFPFSELIF